jgi:hypothetical protein
MVFIVRRMEFVSSSNLIPGTNLALGQEAKVIITDRSAQPEMAKMGRCLRTIPPAKSRPTWLVPNQPGTEAGFADGAFE